MNEGKAGTLDVYGRLQRVLDLHPMGAPGSPEFFEILQELFSPEEARVAAEMGFGLESASEIAERISLPEDKVTALSGKVFIRLIVESKARWRD